PLEHLLRDLAVVPEPAIQVLGKAVPQEGEHATCVQGQDRAQGRGVPEREADTDAPMAPPARHGSPSRRTNPTPRTVWMSFGGASWSTFFRSRAMCTSITLSSGVAREGSFQTSRASISRDTSC